MLLVPAWLDILHDEDVGVGSSLGGVSHQFDLFWGLSDSEFIDGIPETVSIGFVFGEPVEFGGERALSAVGIDAILEDVDETGVQISHEVLEFVVEGH